MQNPRQTKTPGIPGVFFSPLFAPVLAPRNGEYTTLWSRCGPQAEPKQFCRPAQSRAEN